MTAPSYQLDQNEALKGSGGGGGMIDTGGPYIVQIKTAKHRTNQNGTQGVELSLEADDGRTLRLTLWTQNNKGETIYGHNQLQAVMTVLRLRNITPEQSQVEEYDPDQQDTVTVMRDVYPDLHKRVGVLLRREYYWNSNAGEHKISMKLVAPFEPDTKQTAAEVLHQKEAQQLEKMIQGVRDQDPPQQQASTQPVAESAAPSDDFDDDIPF